ncbi:UxaA family hydrolase [Desulfurispora thermophila]|uniref:UxaA family hydrolase n=1 Tax=Desulfurispora thermophila TaxID=265470 RepID=UPI0003638295|nr:altronate dehydratase family protein [Desulfurispora thermophila]
MSNSQLLQIHGSDNVAIALVDLPCGTELIHCGNTIKTLDPIPRGHKVAINNIPRGEQVIKYGYAIGTASRDIHTGQHVHSHNLTTGLAGPQTYQYSPQQASSPFPLPAKLPDKFFGYLRKDGRAGVRNEVWIINTVGCSNGIAAEICRRAQSIFQSAKLDGIFHFGHPYGCSQLGKDQLQTQKILAGLVHHPNAAAVLVLGLGCENNNITSFRQVLGEVDPDRVKFMEAQEAGDEVETALELLRPLVQYAETFTRTELPVSKLVLGLKCGGSDAFSGITANPLVGYMADFLVTLGGSAILTEVPEMFGAEKILMDRAINQEVFVKIVDMINGFKTYFQRYNQPVYENPSPGNKQGGITTLEEKSLGCILKGGHSQVMDVIPYGAQVQKPGLTLLDGPGNDMVAVTALAAAGAQVVLFTTGRGTPLGGPVPTLKIASNDALAKRKPHWIDFSAGDLLAGKSMSVMARDLWNQIIAVAGGSKTRNENAGYREIAIFKDGVTL